MLCANMSIAIKLWRRRPDEVIDAYVMHLKSSLMCLKGVFLCIPMVLINVLPGA